ncbi:MAG: hypothetical protein KGS61_13165 [Verrucomicrobia bacterium]|nr:hypothetical protein [Verrucomicrobiota bacterium]
MLVILRIVFGAALLYGLFEVRQNAQSNPETGDLMNAFFLAVCVIAGILNAIVWAPYFGARIAEPLTGVLTTGPGYDPRNRVMRLILWCERRGYRWLSLGLCFLEGVRHPMSPAAFVVALRQVKPGGWWEGIYAREVFRFSNTQHCLQAYEILKRLGLDPGPHPRPEVNLVLHSLGKPVAPEPARLDVPRAPQTMPLKRDPRIQLFEPDASPGPAREQNGPATEPGGSGTAHPPPPDTGPAEPPPFTGSAQTRVSPPA